jgi:LCP family protein required for cell wall assembly
MSRYTTKHCMEEYDARSRRPFRGSIDGFVRAPAQTSARPVRRLQNSAALSVKNTVASKPKLPPISMELPESPIDVKKQGKKAKKAKKRNFSWWAKRTSLAMVVLLLVTAGTLFGKGYFKLHKVFKGSGATAVALKAHVDPSMLKGEGDGRINILLLGKGGPGHDGPDLTDTVLLASIDPVNGSMSLLSVPRDLWVTVPGGGSSKINAIYANAKYKVLAKNSHDAAGAEVAGITAAEQTVGQVLGVPVHYYTMVDFTAFKQAIDTVGGITIDVPSDLIDPTMAWENHWSSVLARKGVQNFNGTQALLYARSRHGSARGDFDRTERQRLIITALEQKILTAGTFTNPLKISQLLSAFGDHVSTDMSTNDAGRLATIMKNITGNKIISVGLADPPNNYVTTGFYAGQSIVQPVAGVGNYAAIQAYVRNVLRDGYLIKENASITVLNGTSNANAATAEAALLKSYGYNVGTVGDAGAHTYTTTTLVDLTNGADKYTKHYLEQRLDVASTTKLPTNMQPGQAQFVIIVGQR